VTRWLLVVMLASCAKKSDAPAPPPPDDRPKPTLTEAEAARGRDACKAYVDKLCKCGLDGMDGTARTALDDYIKAHPSGTDDPAAVAIRLTHEGKLPIGANLAPLQLCELARPLPDALRVAREVSLSPDSSAKDIAQAEDSARKTIRTCFEELSKLPPLGCK
jgi:hypothetical protein